LPVVAEEDFYPVYLSKGVLLEAQLIAHALREAGAPTAHRVVQLYRAGDVGEQAAPSLAAALKGSGLELIDRRLKSNGSRAERAAQGTARSWCRRCAGAVVAAEGSDRVA
jgi:hypothetical protein